jgi:hypothetical protein
MFGMARLQAFMQKKIIMCVFEDFIYFVLLLFSFLFRPVGMGAFVMWNMTEIGKLWNL